MATTMELLSAFVVFAFVTSVTPGPNNLMLMASGANYGFARSIPHMLGIGIGFTVMIIIVGMGLIGLFDLYPVSYDILQVGSILYLCWLAWKIAHAAAPSGTGEAAGKPMTFFQAAAFQWVNPKAWAMALTAISVYAPGHDFAAIVLIAVIFGAVNIPTVSSWTLLGREMRRFLTSPRRLALFNWTMAGLLVASLLPVLFH